MFKMPTTPAEGPPNAMSQVELLRLSDITGPRRRQRAAEQGQAILRLAGSLRRHGMIHPIVYCDVPWYTVVYCIYCGILWYTVIYCDILVCSGVL